MKRIVYLPLDERPCNRLFPQMMAVTCGEVELIVPPEDILGRKKTPADVEKLWAFLEERAGESDCAVLSAEMLFFGGLLPSRLHHLPEERLGGLTERLAALKRRNPALRLYLFQLIMRTPSYSSSDEEPDYYAQYGAELFRRAYLADKERRVGLERGEQAELAALEAQVPPEVRRDYEERRDFNRRLLEAVLELTAQGVVDLLFIPQDDSSPFGYTALDQHRVQGKIRALGVEDRVYMHPGADEAGAEMVARAYLDLTGRSYQIYVLYGSTLAPQLIPLYEDRILGASAAQHILACGCTICDSPEQADIVLAINAPGKVMQESWEQGAPDVTYQSFRCQPLFVSRIARLVESGRAVAVADCAYANGGEMDFVARLDRAGVLDRLLSYKGWNTNCNTLGTTLAQAILAREGGREEAVRRNLVYHLVDDVLYQAQVRTGLREQLAAEGGSQFALGERREAVQDLAAGQLRALWRKTVVHTFPGEPAQPAAACFPWDRLFEIGLVLDRGNGGDGFSPAP